jgi:uncharacterized membrane protein
MENIALFGHVLGALLFASGIAVAGAAFESARRRDRPGEIAVLLRLARWGVVLVALGGLLLSILGLWLVDLGDFGYGTGWVDAAITLFVLALVLGGLGGRRARQARLLAGHLADKEMPITGELRGLLDHAPSRAANYGSLLLVLAVLVLMVFK